METCRAFTGLLASASPVPGGGGAAALTAALGTALGSMVGALTVGKKSYAPVEEEIEAAMTALEALRLQLLDMVQKDAEGLQTMRTLGRNMAFMMKSIQLGKAQFGLPQKETPIFTSFHR